MSAPESPSALLERAAAKIEASLRMASPGPWRVDVFGDEVLDAFDRKIASFVLDGDARWAVLMGPALVPLVELLRDAARRAEKHAPLSPDGSTFQRSALALARVVLGENTEEAP